MFVLALVLLLLSTTNVFYVEKKPGGTFVADFGTKSGVRVIFHQVVDCDKITFLEIYLDECIKVTFGKGFRQQSIQRAFSISEQLF